ncbi:TRAP transporter substrate-binding protein [Pleomorphochaeta sp. DL1XJH-081]|uniref:TRAP transporter substrate-binding protein n=1 Tax=Pleomorphochaeta sp. DL1XJH-081 TaxID=3409690 RepID=UPI003BB78A2F
MKRVMAMLLILLIATSMFAAGQSEATATTDVVEMRWYQPEPEGHPWTDVGFMIAEEIEEKSNGTLKITMYPSGVLGTQAEAVDMLRTGSLALLTSGPSILASFYDPVQVMSLPYAFDNATQGYAYFESEAGQKIFTDIMKKSGVRTLDVWYFGDRNLTLNGINVQVPKDINGKAVRCMDTPVAKTVVGSLGASPVPINFSELYMALQTGVVVGQENPIPTIIAQKFYEVQDTLVLTKHSVHLGTVHVSETIWQSLTDAQRDAITTTLAKYRPMIEERINKNTEEGLKFLRDKGMKILEPDLAPFKENAKKVIASTFGNNAEWMKVINDLEAFKASYK